MLLTAEQRRELVSALADVFPSSSSLDLVVYDLGKRLDTITHRNTPTEIIFDLIGTAEREGWLGKLLTAIQRDNTENPKLQEFYRRYFAQTQNVELPVLQKETREQINYDLKYISSTPDIMGGAPVITGTRVPIEVILYYLKDGYTLDELQEMYNWIDRQTLEGAIDEAISYIGKALNAQEVS